MRRRRQLGKGLHRDASDFVTDDPIVQIELENLREMGNLGLFLYRLRYLLFAVIVGGIALAFWFDVVPLAK